MGTALEIDGLCFEREGRVVLAISSLSFRSGRRTVILGPNGSGKSTLLRLIAALERATAGEIRINGVPVRPDRATRHSMAFLFQDPVFLRRPVRENIELGLLLRGLGREASRARAHAAAARLGIAELLERRANRLSGGEARRVALAQTLALRAPLLLLDEPLSGLDPESSERLSDELPGLLRETGATTLLVTHGRDEALRLAEDLVVLVDGRVLAHGPRDEVARQPRHAAVARLLGHAVLSAADGMVAVPPGELRLGAGKMEFLMFVEEVVELVDGREAIGRCGDQRVRIALPVDEVAPPAGARLRVHAVRYSVLG